jgi:predicted O-methyltransferase YrrM
MKLNLKRISTGWSYPDDYFLFLYNFIIENDVTNIIELGTRYGDTSMVLATALKQKNGKITTYDITKYPYIEPNFKVNNLQDIITFKQLDFKEWLKSPETFDVLYIDIDNNDKKIELFSQNEFIQKQIKSGCSVIFEAARFNHSTAEIIFKSKISPYKIGKLK